MDTAQKLNILKNETFTPADHRCYELDLSQDKSPHLQQLGCQRLVTVDAPAGSEIRRTGKNENPHIDLMFIQSGTIIISVPGSNYEVNAGQRILLPSWLPRRHLVKSFCRHTYAYFKAPELFPHIQAISIRDCPEVEAVDFYTSQLLTTHSFTVDNIVYRSSLLECLAILFERELRSNISQTIHNRGDELMHFLQNAHGNMLSVSSAAKRFHMSVSAFRLFCHQCFNKSPAQLVIETKMARARALLQYSDIPIAEIAIQLGYADRFAFSKAFTKINNTTPARYRAGIIDK